MVSAKVIFEIRFNKKIPRKVLEDMVILLNEYKHVVVGPYKKIDDSIYAKVWFEDYSKRTDALNPFIKVLKMGKGS